MSAPTTAASVRSPTGRRDHSSARSEPIAVRLADGALDGLVLAFALWTLAYEVLLAARAHVYVPAALWVLVALGVVLLTARFEAGRRERPAPPPRGPVVHPRRLPPYVLPAYAGLVVVAVLVRDLVGVVPLVLLAVGGTVATLLRRRGPDPLPVPAPAPVPPRHHAVAALTCIGLAVLASLIVRPDADDVFYVNRGTWVEQHGVPALRDTMFGAEDLPSSYGGGLPLTSIETLLGALAHLIGMRNGTFTYVAAVPVLSLLVGWALWRLVRSWSPARPLVAFLAAVVYVLISADSVMGGYSISRIWQGKVIATCILLPVVLVQLTRLLERSGRWPQVVLLGAGITFVGLTSAAPLVAMAVAGAALVAAALRRSVALAVGAGAFLLGPLVAGLVAALGPATVGGEDPVPMSAGASFDIFFGPQATLALLGVAALLLATRTVRGPAAVLAGCTTLAAFAALLPGAFAAVNVVTGAGPVAWRLLLVAPLAALVGLLVAAVVDRAVASPGATPGRLAVVALVGAGVAVSGTPQWSGAVGASLSATPRWKVDESALADVQAVSELRTGPGPWLLPPEQMGALSVWTTHHFALVPRSFYLLGIREPVAVTEARVRLYRAIDDTDYVPADVLRADLRELRVSLACAPSDDRRFVQQLRRATGRDLQRVGTMQCHVGPVGPELAPGRDRTAEGDDR